MEQLSTRIGIEPGLGLVGRFGDTVILIPRREAAAGPASAGTAEELLGLAAEVGSDRQAPASAIASRLAAWVIGHMSGDAPAFGIVAPMRDGVVMFLRGAVWCTITEGTSTREVSGEQALTWVDLIVPGTFQRLAIGGMAGRPVQADPLSDLRGGVVPGQGFVLSRTAGIAGSAPALAESGAGSAAAASDPDPDPDSGFGSDPDPDSGFGSDPDPDSGSGSGSGSGFGFGSGSGSGSGSGGFAWTPSEETPPQAADRSEEAWALRAEAQNHQPTMVVRTGEHEDVPSRAEPGLADADRLGDADRLAEADRLGDADRLAEADRLGDARVGAPQPSPAVQPTTVTPVPPRLMAQPPVGVLTSQDGPPIVLDRVYVLGREPQQDPAVESGEASPIQLQDPDHVISRVHAYVSVENGIVLVRDAGSRHGTYFSPPGGEEWTRIGAEPSPLPPGWNLQIGPQVFTFMTTGLSDEQ